MLEKVAASVGMNPEEVKKMLATDKYADEVRYDEHEAAMRGVRGVPYFLFNDKFAVPGALSLDSFKSALKREMRKAEASEMKSEDGERPHVCGPDGCRLD